MSFLLFSPPSPPYDTGAPIILRSGNSPEFDPTDPNLLKTFKHTDVNKCTLTCTVSVYAEGPAQGECTKCGNTGIVVLKSLIKTRNAKKGPPQNPLSLFLGGTEEFKHKPTCPGIICYLCGRKIRGGVSTHMRNTDHRKDRQRIKREKEMEKMEKRIMEKMDEKISQLEMRISNLE